MAIFYTYVIGWHSIKKYYYGSQYNKNANPRDLWRSYFTSSKLVKEHREKYGEPDVIQVRQCFSTQLKTLEYETKVIKRLKKYYGKRFINGNVGGNFIKLCGKEFSEEHKRRLSEASSKHKHTLKSKEKMSLAKKGKLLSEEHKKKISEGLMGIKRPHSDQTKKKISESKKGVPFNITQKVIDSWKNRPPQPQSQKDKVSEKLSFTWKCISPSGDIFVVERLKQFCADHGIDRGNMIKVAQGKFKQTKGWKCEYI